MNLDFVNKHLVNNLNVLILYKFENSISLLPRERKKRKNSKYCTSIFSFLQSGSAAKVEKPIKQKVMSNKTCFMILWN